MVTQVSKFRQSGYKRKSDGVIEMFYGSDKPANPDDYVKVWDNLHTQTIQKEPFVEDDGTHIALNDVGFPGTAGTSTQV